MAKMNKKCIFLEACLYRGVKKCPNKCDKGLIQKGNSYERISGGNEGKE